MALRSGVETVLIVRFALGEPNGALRMDGLMYGLPVAIAPRSHL